MNKTSQSHIFFFPYMAFGHMIPTIDMAKLFPSRGIKTTIISTPKNVAAFSKTIERSRVLGSQMGVLLLKFPCVEVGLPEGCEIAHMVETYEDIQKFLEATRLLEQQLELLLKEHQPNCLVADFFFPWTTDVAAKFGIPRLVFHGTNFISMCVSQHMLKIVERTKHGVKQPNNPWSDGPENITQCPIKPGKNFTYEVIFSDEEGTLWWHAHSDWSRATVHGPIVILPTRGKPYPFPKPYAEETIVLASWFNADVKELIDDAMAVGGDPDPSDGFTINGWPGALYNCTNETIYTLQVVYGKTYLLRLVNAVMNEEMFFGIAGHKFTVVSQDGAYIKPIPTSYIMITPGQTMDILLTANQTPSHYYIASSPFFESGAPFDNTTTTAILQYTGNYTAPATPAMPTLPIVTDKESADNFTSKIRALASKDHPISVPKNVTERIFITVSVNQLPCAANETCGGPNGNRLSASLNNISFASPTTDILQAYYRSLPNVYEDDFPGQPPLTFNYTGIGTDVYLLPTVGTKVKVIEYGATVEMVFQGTNVGNAENHPMHLHGYSFYLVGSAYGNFNETTSPATYNLVDPPEVNTFGVPKNGWATIRFIANNPGVWFMHCHLERHASWGMDTVIVVKNGPTRGTSIQRPPSNLPICS